MAAASLLLLSPSWGSFTGGRPTLAFRPRFRFGVPRPHLFFSPSSRSHSTGPLKFSVKEQQEQTESPPTSPPPLPTPSSSDGVVGSEERSEEEGKGAGQDGDAEGQTRKQQEVDWKTDEQFKKFMGNPSIEAAIKLEKKRADRKLKELDQEMDGNPISRFFRLIARDSLAREKERLEKAEEAFKALDLNKLKSCFGFDTFFAVDVRRFGDGGIFIGNLRKPVEEVIPKLEKKLSEAAGREVVLWLLEENDNDITKQEWPS